MTTELISRMDLYWITRLDYLNTFFAWCIGVGVVSLICFFFWFIDETYGKKKFNFFHFIFVSIFFLTLLLGIIGSIFLPTTKEMIVIQVVPKIASSEFVQTDLPKEAKEMYGIAKDYIKSKLSDKKASTENKDTKDK